MLRTLGQSSMAAARLSSAVTLKPQTRSHIYVANNNSATLERSVARAFKYARDEGLYNKAIKNKRHLKKSDIRYNAKKSLQVSIKAKNASIVLRYVDQLKGDVDIKQATKFDARPEDPEDIWKLLVEDEIKQRANKLGKFELLQYVPGGRS